MRLRLTVAILAAALCGAGLWGAGGAPFPATAPRVGAQSPVDATRLPWGDGRLSRAPGSRGGLVLQTMFGGGGAFQDGGWLRGDGTFDMTAKPVVDGGRPLAERPHDHVWKATRA